MQALTRLGVPALDGPVEVVNAIGGTTIVLAVALGSAVLAVALLCTWRPTLFLAVAVAGEVTAYLVVSRLVVGGRGRRAAPCRTWPASPPATPPRA